MSAAVTPIRTGKGSATKVWLSPEQACDRAPGLTTRRLADLRESGRGPRYYKPTNKTVLYEQAEFDRWIESTVVSTRDSA